ncbi:3D domain-containing protein [Bacillus sp. CGMCC 1.16541]|uniref:3D domain-containing protein n=1 Tax=Bacillus sp. CGMCC 1.16541 TaxID=2185143 RepID=UPI000D73FE65|nr:3D domain-containing protein [Bacillus sp. CGMCC 1.16541]
MKILRNMVLMTLAFVLSMSSMIETHAQTSQDTLRNMEQQLQQHEETLKQKEKEKQSVQGEVQNIQTELNALHNVINDNKEDLAQTEQKIKDIRALIEERKEEIIVLQEKVMGRKDVMEQRLVSLQQSDQTNAFIDTLFSAENFSDFVARVTAVTTLFNADRDILTQHQDDLNRIEENKKEIDKQEKNLVEEQQKLADKQVELDQNLQARQVALTAMQEKYSQVVNELTMAEQEKVKISSQMREAQETIKREQEAARQRAAQLAKAKAERERAAKEEAQAVAASKPAPSKSTPSKPVAAKSSKSTPSKPVAAKPSNKPAPKPISSGKEFYVSATAYSHEETNANGGWTAAGYNIKNNPNMKLIAVDPSVIPLGKKVWVEGYGVAVAGDTGGAIKGYKIDVLMPSKSAALSWGRKQVKVKVLD